MKLVILSRDGVINHRRDVPINSVDDWMPIEGSIEAMARFTQAGFNVVIATNQPGLAQSAGFFSTLSAIHQKMYEVVLLAGGHIDGVFFCPHAVSDQCGCRKPEPGLLYEIADRFSVSLQHVFVIGDSLLDVTAAQHATALPVLVRTGKGLETEKLLAEPAIPVFDNLHKAATAILDQGLSR